MKNKQLLKKINKTIGKDSLKEMAKTSRFKIRNSGKLKPEDFLWISCFSGHNLCDSSLEELCASLNLRRDVNISPQALDQRFTNSSTEFLKYIFISLCKDQYKSKLHSFKSSGFSKIFLMDSTEIKLPGKLKEKYKGSNSNNSSVLKMNLLLELLNYSIKNIELSSGVTNEQNFSRYIYDELCLDSLVLKDLGYFNFKDFNEIDERNSFFISRLRAGIRLFIRNPNPKLKKNGEPLKKTKYLTVDITELGKELKVGEAKEYEFLLGSHDDKRPFRVILTKLDEKSTNKKIKDIEERERRKGHSAKHARKSAEISGYITNLESFEPLEIIELYSLRWQIELLFKIFKSDFKLDKLKNIKLERIESHIYATLIRILILMEVTKEAVGGYSEELSIRRVIKSSMEVLNNFLEVLKLEENFERLLFKLEKICCSKIKKSPAN